MKEHARIVAFLLTNSASVDSGYIRACAHLRRLSSMFNLDVVSYEEYGFRFLLCYDGEISKLVSSPLSNTLTFQIGPPLGQINNSIFKDSAVDKNVEIRDRFLQVSIRQESITVTTDYAATIPCFYSTRSHVSFSNLEPLVVLDSNCTLDDIDVSSMYAFLRYSHFIWERTLYKHIRMQEPDSKLVWREGAIKTNNLQTIKVSDERVGFSDTQIASALYELNEDLVVRALAWPEKILLPLSAGYDSRMILSVCAKKSDLRMKLKALTYGPNGSIEVKAARDLCQRYNVEWQRIELPCRFLTKGYLEKVGAIFGSSLHFHGMYQLEFADNITGDTSQGVFTSGFMTGVPAGQHISLLNITSAQTALTEAMNHFSQSSYWTDSDLLKLNTQFKLLMLQEAETEFKKAFDRIEGEIFQKSVVFDIWTRQRNFIAYHPRTLEWIAPFISPHMCPQYANFFLSLSKRHLTDRLAVELMFKKHYPISAVVPANSNGLKALSGLYNLGLWPVRVAKKLHLEMLLPEMYVNQALDFDIPAIQFSRYDGVWPMFQLNKSGKEFLTAFFPETLLNNLVQSALAGSNRDYNRLVFIQAIAYGIGLVTQAIG